VAEEDDEAGDLVVFDREEVTDGHVTASPEQVDLDGDPVPVDDQRSGIGTHVVVLEQGVAVEVDDRFGSFVPPGVGDELGVISEARRDRVGVVRGDGRKVGAGDVGRLAHRRVV
jgi:hypothetical protein